MPEAPRRRTAARGEGRRPASRPKETEPTQREPTQRRRASGEDREDGAPKPDRRAAGDSNRRLPVRQLVASAREQLEEVIGRPVSGVLGLEPDDDGWQLTLEVVELARIPETTSILGCYVAHLDEDGELTDYRRIRRYNRSQPDEDP